MLDPSSMENVSEPAGEGRANQDSQPSERSPKDWLMLLRGIPVVQAESTGYRILSHLDPWIITQAISLKVPRMLDEDRAWKATWSILQENKLKLMDKDHNRERTEPELQPEHCGEKSCKANSVIYSEETQKQSKSGMGKQWHQCVWTSGWEVRILNFYSLWVNTFLFEYLLLTDLLFTKQYFNTHFTLVKYKSHIPLIVIIGIWL